MKQYEKPILEVVELRVKENLANNTTFYNMALAAQGEDPTAGDISSL